MTKFGYNDAYNYHADGHYDGSNQEERLAPDLVNDQLRMLAAIQ